MPASAIGDAYLRCFLRALGAGAGDGGSLRNRLTTIDLADSSLGTGMPPTTTSPF